MSSFSLFSASQPRQTSLLGGLVNKVWSAVKSFIRFVTTPFRKVINFIFPNTFKNDDVKIDIYPVSDVSIILM